MGHPSEALLSAGLFEDLLGDVFCCVGFEEAPAVVTTDVMKWKFCVCW